MTENEAYDQVAAEVTAGKLEPGLWARAFSEAMGLQDQARALYIKLRVAEIMTTAKTEAEAAREAERIEKRRQEAIERANNAAIDDRGMGFVWLVVAITLIFIVIAHLTLSG